VILTDLGYRLELRAESALPGLGRLEALAFKRISREQDWIVAIRGVRDRRAVPDKAAAREALEAYRASRHPTG
jgi:hypothetical protein